MTGALAYRPVIYLFALGVLVAIGFLFINLFAELAPDGRFRRIEETTLLLEGAEGDRNMGSAR